MQHNEVIKRAEKYFDAGFNCAQAVALSNIETFGGKTEGIIQLTAGFGHGLHLWCFVWRSVDGVSIYCRTPACLCHHLCQRCFIRLSKRCYSFLVKCYGWSGSVFSDCQNIWSKSGRKVVEKLVTPVALNKVDGFFARYGKYAILLARLLPFISFDVVSYAAGLTAIGFWEFFWATASDNCRPLLFTPTWVEC